MRSQNTQSKPLQRYKNIYMQQHSPSNPFGPNYIQLPLNTKVHYKYSLAKQYFNLNSQDNTHKQIEEQKFLGTLILGFVSGYFIVEIPRLILSKVYQRQINRGLPLILSICTATSYAYILAHQRYFEQVPNKFLPKYLHQAIDNGFEDYKISIKQNLSQ